MSLVTFTRQTIYKTIITPRQSSTKVQPIEPLNTCNSQIILAVRFLFGITHQKTLICILCSMYVIPPLIPLSPADTEKQLKLFVKKRERTSKSREGNLLLNYLQKYTWVVLHVGIMCVLRNLYHHKGSNDLDLGYIYCTTFIIKQLSNRRFISYILHFYQ